MELFLELGIERSRYIGFGNIVMIDSLEANKRGKTESLGAEGRAAKET